MKSITSPLVGEVAAIAAGEGYNQVAQMIKKFQKALRANQTDAERCLWYSLRSRRFQGWKFRRQHTLQGYIVDFACLERKLVIELDGGQHVDQKAYDHYRTWVLEKDGFKVLRFWNHDVLSNLEGVLETILSSPSPALIGRPLPQRGEVVRISGLDPVPLGRLS